MEVEKKLNNSWSGIDYPERSLDEVLKIKEDVYDLLIVGKLDTSIQFQSFQDMINQISMAGQSTILMKQSEDKKES